MVDMRKLMDDYNPNDEGTIILAELHESEKKHVLVTHDETYFYASDDAKMSWVTPGETILKKKDQGRAIMVSDFVCPCHGSMNAFVDGVLLESSAIIKPGKNEEGWWTSERMMTQICENALFVIQFTASRLQGRVLFRSV